jgi:threonine aldolase
VVAADTSGSTELFKFVNFNSDGLDLDPREYAFLLKELTATEAGVKADNYTLGGAVEELEKKFALVLGKESAIVLPTGTLANHLAVRKLAGNDRRVLVQAESHLYNDTGDGAEILSGLNLIPLAQGQATFSVSEVRQWVDRSAGGRVESKVGVISIENPVRRKHHEMFEPAAQGEICAYARANGIRLHLDGARLFALPQHTGRSVREHVAPFDTVYVSLWKHFNGAADGILAGEKKFIDGLFQTRRMFGGSLPRAWPMIALVEPSMEIFSDGYARAWRVADEFLALLQKDSRFTVQKVTKGTSRFLLTVPAIVRDQLAVRLLKQGVVLPHPLSDGAFPMQVNLTLNRTNPEALARKFFNSLQG